METTMTRMKIMQKRERVAKRLSTLMIYTSMILAIFILASENKQLKSTVNELYASMDIQEQEHNLAMIKKDGEIGDLQFIIDGLNDVIDTLDQEIQKVAAVNESYVDELNMLRKRSELYDKYEYAIIHEGKRTELKYEEIEYGEDLMLTKGIDPDLMFGSIMVESRANPAAVNKSSGATGYGQFLDSTAKFVWTNLLGNNGYYSDIRKDGMVNIQMMAEYYDYLYDMYGNTFKVVKHYSGNSTNEGTSIYLAEVNRFTSKVGEIIK